MIVLLYINYPFLTNRIQICISQQLFLFFMHFILNTYLNCNINFFTNVIKDNFSIYAKYYTKLMYLRDRNDQLQIIQAIKEMITYFSA